MPTVGNVYVDFAAETAKFTSGVDSINAKLDAFGKKAGEAHGASEGMFGAVAGGELLASGIEKVGDMAVEAAHHVAEMVEETMEQTAATHRLAESLDISTSSLQSLQAAGKLGAGLDPQTMNAALEHLTAKLGEAADKGGETADSLKAIGLDAGQLAQGGTDEAFRKIATSLGQMDNAFDRARLARELFGKSGGENMGQVGKELEKNEALARKFGVAMSLVDLKKITEAQEASEQLGLQVQGAWDQVTATVAPAVTFFAGVASDIVGYFFNVSEADQKAAERVQHAKAAEAAKQSAHAIAEATKEITKGYDEAKQAIDTFGMSAGDKKIYDLEHQFKNLTAAQLESVSATRALNEQLDEMERHDKVGKDLAEQLEKINVELAEIGMTANEKKIFEFKAHLSLDDKITDQVNKISMELAAKRVDPHQHQQFEALKSQKEDLEEMIKHAESMRNPMNAAGDTGLNKDIHDYSAMLDDVKAKMLDLQHLKTLPEIQIPEALKSEGAVKQLEYLKKKMTELGMDTSVPQAMQKQLDDLTKEAEAADHLADRMKGAHEADRAHALNDEILKLRESVQGLTETERELDKLKSMGAGPATLDEAKGLLAQHDALEKQKKDIEDIKRLAEAGKSPFEKWADTMKTMSDLLQQHKITQEEFNRAAAKANEERVKALDLDKEAGALSRRFDFRMISQAQAAVTFQPPAAARHPRPFDPGQSHLGDGGSLLTKEDERELNRELAAEIAARLSPNVAVFP